MKQSHVFWNLDISDVPCLDKELFKMVMHIIIPLDCSIMQGYIHESKHV